jgi:rhomboid protease GluP
MTFDDLLTVAVCIWCIVLMARAMRAWRDARGWFIASALVLFVTVALFIVDRASAGVTGLVLWLLLILVPSLGVRGLNRLSMQQRYADARRLALVLRLLHPADGWWEQPNFLLALQAGAQGDTAQASKILGQLRVRARNQDTPMARRSVLELFRITQDWTGALAWFAGRDDSFIQRDPYLMSIYLRALGETGDLNGLAAAYEQFRRAFEPGVLADYHDGARLYLFAFCGRLAALDILFSGPLRNYRPAVQRYWRAVAALASGEERGWAELQSAASGADAGMQRAMQWRLSRPLADAGVTLTAASLAIVSNAERNLGHERQFGERYTPVRRRAYATYALIALNVVMFLVELGSGDPESARVLFRLGALAPGIGDEWWRLFASLFLHAGLLHIAFNMLALYALGPFVEYTLGLAGYVLTYLVSGLGAGLLLIGLTAAGALPMEIYVGASGCIMGLVGATAAILLRGWLQHRARAASQRLLTIILIIALQFMLDVLTPQVSLAAHLGGMIAGFLAASLLRYRTAVAPARSGAVNTPG